MMTHACRAEVLSIALVGLDPHLIHIEAVAQPGSSSFNIVGLSEAQTRETRVRVRASLQHIGIALNELSITVQITPGNLSKGGVHDVAIALAVLGAIGHVSMESLAKTIILGELSLTAVVRPARGVLPSLRGAVAQGITRAIVPKDNAREAASMPGIRVRVAGQLYDLVRFLREGIPLESAGEPPPFPSTLAPGVDMADIRGMHGARRALEIAAAGGHDLLFMGPPGAGKTLLARRLPGILLPLTLEEALEVTAIHSVAGLLSAETGILGARPFRFPHHTVSAAGMVGGGDPVRPGEVSLAHHGVLLLDELVEFKGAVLEALGPALREGSITVCRAKHRASFPARPLLVGAVNPCPCGYAGERLGRCTCPPERLKNYRERLQRPFFEHFDMKVVLPPADVAELQASPRGESSVEVQKRVIAAREFQTGRAGLHGAARTNAQLSPRDLERFASPDAAGLKVMAQAVERLKLSKADCGRVLRVARTIADLDGSDAVRAPHVAEAIHAIVFPSAPSSGASV